MNVSESQVWIDETRCAGCGLCAGLCPTEAIALVEGVAQVDPETCTGCGACMDACPHEAIQPVIEGRLIVSPERPASTPYQPSPVATAAGTAIAVAGARVALRVASVVARVVGRWIAGRSAMEIPRNAPDTRNARDVETTARTGRGRRARHRRRGDAAGMEADRR